jgi:hypothetical protein
MLTGMQDTRHAGSGKRPIEIHDDDIAIVPS